MRTFLAMHNPPHPGEFIESIYMESHDINCRYLAEQLGVAASTLNCCGSMYGGTISFDI